MQVRDIAEAQRFYQEVLGCLEGARDEHRFDVNLYGYPIGCQLNPQLGQQGRVTSQYNLAAGKYVPVSHCRVTLETTEWRSLAKRLKQHRVKFVIERYRHLKGAPGAQATLFLLDPSGNVLEVQAFCKSAKELSRWERRRVLAGWLPWVILTAFIVGCILLLPKKSDDGVAAGNPALPAHVPPCARTGCIP